MPAKVVVVAVGVGMAVVTAVVAGIVFGGALRGQSDDSPPAAAATPVGERENPLGASSGDGPQVTPSASETPSGAPGDSEGAADAGAGAAGAGTASVDDDDCLANALRELTPGALLLLEVEFEVRGFGPGGTWVWYRCGGGVGGDEFVGSAGDCTLLTPDFDRWAAAVLVNPEAEPPDRYENAHFTAGVRVSQNDFVSLGYNEEAGITTGGLSLGGGRGGEQWIIGGGTFDSSVRVLPPVSRDLTLFRFSATWSGTAAENFTSEQADGVIVVSCEIVAR